MALQLYNQEIAELHNLKDIEPNVYPDTRDDDLAMLQQTNQLVKSGIIEGLYEQLRYSEFDFNKITRPTFTGKIRNDNVINNDIKDYYSNRVQQQADIIIQYIDGLIFRDGYPKSMFGDYKFIKAELDNRSGLDKAYSLNKLRICALTAIPADIKNESPRIIEPSIGSNARTQ
jgi:hypothetical protein